MTRPSHRRSRDPYRPLSRPSQIQAVLDDLTRQLPQLPKDLPALYRVLCAARHPTDSRSTRRGRPAQYDRGLRDQIRTTLQPLLYHHAGPGLTVASFVDNQVRLLVCFPDVQEAVERGELNIAEALVLNRVKTADRRWQLLETHLKQRGSARALRRRVREVLNPTRPHREGKTRSALPSESDAWEVGPDQLFAEQLRYILTGLQEIDPGDLEETDLNAILRLSEELGAVLYRVARKQAARSNPVNNADAEG